MGRQKMWMAGVWGESKTKIRVTKIEKQGKEEL